MPLGRTVLRVEVCLGPSELASQIANKSLSDALGGARDLGDNRIDEGVGGSVNLSYQAARGRTKLVADDRGTLSGEVVNQSFSGSRQCFDRILEGQRFRQSQLGLSIDGGLAAVDGAGQLIGGIDDIGSGAASVSLYCGIELVDAGVNIAENAFESGKIPLVNNETTRVVARNASEGARGEDGDGKNRGGKLHSEEMI